jgi:RimJ/RimL family protein N-acetyltransferase
MPAPNQSMALSKTIVRIDSDKFLVRTIEADDASDRWAGWMSDPEVRYMLNMAPRSWKKADVASYIDTFNQGQNLLLGIFDKQSGTHVGICTIDINPALGHFLLNLLIGEPDYRNKHVTTSIAESSLSYFFETRGLNTAVASVLAHNAPMIHWLRKNGWQLEQTRRQSAKSHADGTMLDVCLFSLRRESWRAWKQQALVQGDKR